MTPAEYWAGNSSLVHITPPGERYPEIGLLPILQGVGIGTVFEFGCGDGRLAPAFDPSRYVGHDINPHALTAAKAKNPKHRFVAEPEAADTFLAHTVLLHIPDDEIGAVAGLARSYPRVIIGEVMGRKWRRPGNPPVFNREAPEYVDLIGRPCREIAVPYPRYGCDLTLMVFG